MSKAPQDQVADVLALVAEATLETAPPDIAGETPVSILMDGLPPGGVLARMWALTWACPCGETGSLRGLCMPIADGMVDGGPACPRCHGENIEFAPVLSVQISDPEALQ